jgi:hypothetical protein
MDFNRWLEAEKLGRYLLMDLKLTGASSILILNLRFLKIFSTGCPFVCLWENPLGVIQNALPTFLMIINTLQYVK